MRAEGETLVLSCVGGGPMQRLANCLSVHNRRCAVVARYGPAGWRSCMANGPMGRFRARVGACLVFPCQAILAAIHRRPTSLIVTTNPFFLPMVMLLTRWLHRRPIVALVYDLYPDAFEIGQKTRLRELFSRIASAMNRCWFRHVDGIVFIGPVMAERALARYGPSPNWRVLETGADVSEFGSSALGASDAVTDLERWCDQRVVLSYVGNLGHVHDWETLASAIPSAIQRARPQTGLVVVASGPGVTRWRAAWRDQPGELIRFEEPLDDVAWARLLSRSSVALVTLRMDAAHTSIPSKTFSAMAAGNAVIAIAPGNSDLAALVRRHECGKVVDPGDVTETVAAICELVNDKSELERCRANAFTASQKYYDLEVLAPRWNQFLSTVERSVRGSIPK